MVLPVTPTAVCFDVGIVVPVHSLVPNVRSVETVVPLFRRVEDDRDSAVLADASITFEDADSLRLHSCGIESSWPQLATLLLRWLAAA
jgi:hypothetical protein